MKRVKERKIAIFIVMVLVVMFLITGCGSTEDTTDLIYDTSDITVEPPTSDFYVNDFANIISDENKALMMERAVKLDQDYNGTQVVVSTVTTLNGYNIDEYSYAMYNQYGIGKDDMGVLICLSTGDREIKVETGIKMEEYLPASKLGRLVDDYVLDDLKNNKFNEALEILQSVIIDYIEETVPVPNILSENDKSSTDVVSNNTTSNNSSLEESSDSSSNNSRIKIILIILIVLLILFAIFCLALIYVTYRNAKDSVRKYKNQYQKSQKDIKAKSDEISNLESKYSRKIKQITQEYEDTIRKNAVNFHAELHNKDLEIENLKSENIKTNSELRAVSQNFLRAVTLHPELEKEIHDMIENEFKESARKIDQKISDAAAKRPDKDLIFEFEEVVSSYNLLNPEVAKYVTGDIKPISSLYDQSVEMKKEYDRQEKEKKDKKKAVEAQRIMQSLVKVDCETTYEDYSDFSEAMLIYESLTRDQRNFFPDPQWLEHFKEKHADVERAHNHYMSAKRSEQKIYDIVDRIGRPDENDRENIKAAMNFYDKLSLAERKYFNHQLYETLKQMKKLADDDYDDQERKRKKKREEEKRRRDSMYHSSGSNFHSHSSSSVGSSHIGHGGHTNGGGIHRGF